MKRIKLRYFIYIDLRISLNSNAVHQCGCDHIRLTYKDINSVWPLKLIYFDYAAAAQEVAISVCETLSVSRSVCQSHYFVFTIRVLFSFVLCDIYELKCMYVHIICCELSCLCQLVMRIAIYVLQKL